MENQTDWSQMADANNQDYEKLAILIGLKFNLSRNGWNRFSE